MVPFQRVFHVLVIAQPIALDDVQLVAIGRTEQVDHPIIAVGLDGDGLDHQRVALVMADGISVPGGLHRRRMGRFTKKIAPLQKSRKSSHTSMKEGCFITSFHEMPCK
jgi:hypothetical protein